MSLSSKILKSVSEGVLNVLSFKDELESSEEFDIQMSSAKQNIDKNERQMYINHLLDKFLNKEIKYISVEDIEYIEESYRLYNIQYAMDDDKMNRGLTLIETFKCYKKDINMNWLDVSKVTNFNMLFGYSKFTGDISKWNVRNAKNMSYMFYESDFNNYIGDWNIPTNCITDRMFYNCKIDKQNMPKCLKS